MRVDACDQQPAKATRAPSCWCSADTKKPDHSPSVARRRPREGTRFDSLRVTQSRKLYALRLIVSAAQRCSQCFRHHWVRQRAARQASPCTNTAPASQQTAFVERRSSLSTSGSPLRVHEHGAVEDSPMLQRQALQDGARLYHAGHLQATGAHSKYKPPSTLLGSVVLAAGS
jgi:hypothetical protein